MIIEAIIPEKVSGAEAIAKLTGVPYVPPRGHYRVDGNDYWNVFFGIAYPDADTPGAVVSVAVRKQIDNPELVVRDLVTARDIMELYRRGDEIRQRYCTEAGKIGTIWYGEPGRFEELRTEHNKQYKDNKDRKHRVVIGGPDGDETADSGVKYLSTMLDLAGVDRLVFLPGCEPLRSAVEVALSTSTGTSISAYDPMIMALGFACRAIMVQRPWLQRLPTYRPPKDKHEWAKGKSPWKIAIRRKKSMAVAYDKNQPFLKIGRV